MTQGEVVFGVAGTEAARKDLRATADGDREDLQVPAMKRRYTGERALSTTAERGAESTDIVKLAGSMSEVKAEVALCLVQVRCCSSLSM